MFPLPRQRGPQPPFLSLPGSLAARPLPAAPPGRRAGTLCKCNLSAGPAPAGKPRRAARNAAALRARSWKAARSSAALTENPTPGGRQPGPFPPGASAPRSLFVPQLPCASLCGAEPLHHTPSLGFSHLLFPLSSWPCASRSPPPARWPEARFLSLPRRPQSTRKGAHSPQSMPDCWGEVVPLVTSAPPPARELWTSPAP